MHVAKSMIIHGQQWYPSLLLIALILLSLLAYTIYFRFLHPLSKYPGPFWASITNVYKAYQISTLNLPTNLVSLHEQYGDIVRIGPNDLSIRSPSAYNQIYKGGRSLPKTKFYDAFTAFNPNLFGTQDEKVFSLLISLSGRLTVVVTRRPTSSDGPRVLPPVHPRDGIIH